MHELLKCDHLSKQYDDGKDSVHILNNVNLTVHTSEQLAIIGSSGSGKSTLLHLLGALDQPTSGSVLFEQQDIFAFSNAQQAKFRNQSLGFVYQAHHLLPEFSALENVAMPRLIANEKRDQALHHAEEMLKKVGLSHRLTHRPSMLSGGERQRVAIARALVNQPKLVLADEPTGNLDTKTGEGIYQLLNELRDLSQTSFIVVTHDIQLAKRLDRSLSLVNGQLSSPDV
ncbi:lipoprotein-releasing ABC transporter ATP-binding protein LolD [Paraglaciecola agarilytica]|jgi:lipoprotein-releasing system ATP-binding protein|uniref:lipoprotein-releasing ABC transporter ATP-binding protein LolD n=1 Tax=Paraglaciecola chathamensis TaxID=368405 RepID=UPI00020A7217|nr:MULTISPECIES: lipoprotein-releasing ABC transporter ATP-binding protein LolD [Paraglaciecola]AEE22950.1 lipoprotein releasing system, ATP-binding protein [Glaciecola sp. 4H-3-7+YE-5]MBU3019736.1 lipoprotein-releasing ABC transporter ATP-binding protein LolD [Paraglaciecola agarilytica]MDO6559458.1 lipoprotein-releasing ABC transporter ATP-binding protein LolD [Paraglaciecola chathamensis]MDO6840997.1 lipoprotein-releasing ABC transporter ATP-binding protein LolD [Paraglaciecola chathamensis]